MENKFTKAMQNRSNADLLKIVNELRDDYQPEAVSSAEMELAGRNLSQEQVYEAENENKIQSNIKSEKANMKLDAGWKVLSFIFPGVIPLFAAGYFKSEGYDRKAQELIRWTFYGFGFYIGIGLLITINIKFGN